MYHGVILNNLQFILVYLGLKFGIKRFMKDKLSEVDFKKYNGYYREILKYYSPAELSYIDDFEMQHKNDVVATLLSLELNKKISLDNDYIRVEQNHVDKVSSNESYVLDNIEDGKLNNFNENEFMKKVQEDTIKNGLLKESKIEWRNVTKIIVLCLFIIILMIFVFANLFNEIINTSPSNVEDWKIFAMVFSILLAICLPIFLGVYLFTYIMKSKMNSYIRTSKGEEINERLEGLKNYLNDYSLMNKRDENSLNIWDDYLIYSVIFNQNTKIVKNIYDKYVGTRN